MEKIKAITLTDNETNETYILEFNRESIKFAESKGFVVDDVAKYPMTKGYEFFFYAFRMHHKMLPREKTDKLLDALGGIAGAPDGLFERLGELYANPFNTLVGDSKNGKVTVDL